MGTRLEMRKDLSAPGLYARIREIFTQVEVPGKSREFEGVDYLMSGLALFALKYPSLLQFDLDRLDKVKAHNLNKLFGIEKAPCDTHLRQRLDGVDPRDLRIAFKKLLAVAQRGKVLESFTYLEGDYLLSVDGTGYFSSSEVHCANCCERQHRDGGVTYYHHMLSASLVHPEHHVVLPIAPEPIVRDDGASKNDCESNAAKRLLRDFRREHPHLACTVVMDALYCNAPQIQLLQELNLRFIVTATAADHEHLFAYAQSKLATPLNHEVVDESGVTHRFCCVNDAPLNKTHYQQRVNLMQYWEITPAKGKRPVKQQRFSWVTDHELKPENLMQVMRAARARWRIENETFNTLKNQGYHFEHNFGHGHRHLSTVMAYLMMLAFFIDQLQQLCCPLFQAARAKLKAKSYFWRDMRAHFISLPYSGWDQLYHRILNGYEGPWDTT